MALMKSSSSLSTSSSSSSTKAMVLKSLSIVALLSFCGVTTTGVLAINQVRGEQQRNQRKQSSGHGHGHGPSAAVTTTSAASASDFDEIIHRAEESLKQQMKIITAGGGDNNNVVGGRRRLSFEEPLVGTRNDGKGKGKDNGKGKGKGKDAIDPPTDEECGLFEIDLMCHAFVGGSTTPVPCETLDDSVCDVTVQYKINISNEFSSSPTMEPSAEPSVEPSVSAAPSSVGGKGGKGKEDSSGKGGKDKDGGKGKDKGKGKSSDTCSSTGALVIDQLSLKELFVRVPGGDDCPKDLVLFELPEKDIVIPPGGDITFEGSTFDINICQCHAWAYFVGITATEESDSGDEPSAQPSISASPSSEGKGGKGKENGTGKGKTGGKGKGKSGDEGCESCFLIGKDVESVAKSPSSSPSAEPTISISPSVEPSISVQPSSSSSPSNAPTAKSGKKGGGKKGGGKKGGGKKGKTEEPTESLTPSISSVPSPSPSISNAPTSKSGKKGGGKKGGGKKGKSDAPSAAPSEEEVFPVCFICGEGEEVTIPGGIVQFPNPFPPPEFITVTCQQLDDAGKMMLIAPETCEVLRTEFGSQIDAACGCMVTSAPTESSQPSIGPSEAPSLSSQPSMGPSEAPTESSQPSLSPSLFPSESSSPSIGPSDTPSVSNRPSMGPSSVPTVSLAPSLSPSESQNPTQFLRPSLTPSESSAPSQDPSMSPSSLPSDVPSASPSASPSATPSASPSSNPSLVPSAVPSSLPSIVPSAMPTITASAAPSLVPSQSPSASSPTFGPIMLFPSCDICPGPLENPEIIVDPPITCGILSLLGEIGFIDPDTCKDIRAPQGQGIRINRLCCLPFIQTKRCCGPCGSGGNGGCIPGLTCVNDFCVPADPDEICNDNYNGGNGEGAPFVPPGTGGDATGFTFCANPDSSLCGTANPYEQRNGDGNSLFCCDENLDEYTDDGPTCAQCDCGDTVVPGSEPCGVIYGPPEDPDPATRFQGQCPDPDAPTFAPIGP